MATLNESKIISGHLWYNPVTDMYLCIKYFGSGEQTDLLTHGQWTFTWVEEAVITTWVSFNGDEGNRLHSFMEEDKDKKYGMLVPFVYKEVREPNTICINHIRSVPFKVADLNNIIGLYV